MAIHADNLTTETAEPLSIDWQEALVRHDRWLRMVVLVRSGDSQAVDEILQEVSLAAVRQSAPLQSADKVAPWLYRLAVHQSLMHRRKLGRQRRLHNNYADRCGGSSGSRPLDPLSWLLADERQKLVRQALAKLPGKDAEILLLKYAEGWNYQQIADHVGVSHSAIEARLHRARLKLRTELESLEQTEVHR